MYVKMNERKVVKFQLTKSVLICRICFDNSFFNYSGSVCPIMVKLAKNKIFMIGE